MAELTEPALDVNLIGKYGGEGPRYTSYPTAVQFRPDFTGADLEAAIDESNRLPIPPDLSVYIHVPYCVSPCFYCACNRVITRSSTAGQEFLVHLEKEIRRIAPQFDDDRPVRQIHLGGGTPTFLRVDQIRQMLALIRTHFPVAADAEIGLEVDPRTIDPAGIRELRQMGFNRISVGIQDLDEKVQKAINRVHDTAMVGSVIGAARGVGYDSISVDLIYGLPLQTTTSFARTIESVISMAPDRISLFHYAHLPHYFKAQRQIDDNQLPSSTTKLAIFRNTLSRLLEAGYEFIGMDHFARPTDSLVRARRNNTLVRNFQGYSTHGGLDLIGFGPSAISQIGDSFAQNHRKIEDWTVEVLEGRIPVARGLVRNTDDRIRADIIEHIMCRNKVDFRGIERAYELTFRRYFADELSRLEAFVEDGLVELTDRSLQVTARGLMFLRAIAAVFDAYLAPDGHTGGRFSRIV